MISALQCSPTHTEEAVQTPRWWTLNSNWEGARTWSDCLKNEQTVRGEQKWIPTSSGEQKASLEIWVCGAGTSPAQHSSPETGNDTGTTLDGAFLELSPQSFWDEEALCVWDLNNPGLALKFWVFIDSAAPLSTLSLVCCYFRQRAGGLVPPAMALRMTKPLYSIQENWMDEGQAGQRSWYFEKLLLFRSGLLTCPHAFVPLI